MLSGRRGFRLRSGLIFFREYEGRAVNIPADIRVKRRAQSGSAILESYLSFFILLLVFFGLFQLFKLSIARIVTDYASFRGARSSAVGFSNNLVDRETRVKVIPVSGDMVFPESSDDMGTPYEQFYKEKIHIEKYMDGTRWLEYAYWYGRPIRHSNYKCPLYGQLLSEGSCSVCALTASPSLSVGQHTGSETAAVTVTFNNYPLNLPLHDVYTDSDSIRIESKTELTNHAAVYLEE